MAEQETRVNDDVVSFCSRRVRKRSELLLIVRRSVAHYRATCPRFPLEETSMQHDSSGYWKATLSLLTKILIVWFVVSFGAGILFADLINGIHLGGYPLGFWFAHQGSIYIFIVLIFYYAKKMGDIDREFDVHED
jgi:putative solute:sodium symporter small subunit